MFFCLALSGAAVSTQGAQDATPASDGDVVYAPDEIVHGATLGEWLARSWQYAASFPADVSPWYDETGERCGYGQFGPVWILPGTFLAEPPDPLRCTVPEGVAILTGTVSAECSTVEPPPFFGRNEQELQACAAQWVDTTGEQSIALDGEEVADLDQYRVTSPLFTMIFPEDNDWGVPAGVAEAVAEGYTLILKPLPVGEHELVLTVEVEGEPLSLTYLITVEAPYIIEPEGTPEATPAA